MISIYDIISSGIQASVFSEQGELLGWSERPARLYTEGTYAQNMPILGLPL